MPQTWEEIEEATSGQVHWTVELHGEEGVKDTLRTRHYRQALEWASEWTTNDGWKAVVSCFGRDSNGGRCVLMSQEVIWKGEEVPACK